MRKVITDCYAISHHYLVIILFHPQYMNCSIYVHRRSIWNQTSCTVCVCWRMKACVWDLDVCMDRKRKPITSGALHAFAQLFIFLNYLTAEIRTNRLLLVVIIYYPGSLYEVNGDVIFGMFSLIWMLSVVFQLTSTMCAQFLCTISAHDTRPCMVS